LTKTVNVGRVMSDTHEEFDVIWRDSKYFVSTPELDTIRVVPLLRYNAMKLERDKALKQLEAAYNAGYEEGEYRTGSFENFLRRMK